VAGRLTEMYVADEPVTTYNEPAVIWRMVRGRDHARATVIPGAPESTLVFFVNDQFEKGQNVADWAQALDVAARMKRQLVEDGWTEE
jgi:hypothetical protein